MRTNGVVLRRPKVLICLFVCVSVVAFLVPVNVISAHEGNESSVVVHVTDKGFEPRSVEIQSGDTVVFKNVGDEAHWPASDDHPTHEEYSEFDPKKPIQPNKQWSFTFDRPGKWEYHDHTNPYLMGEVVALEDASGHESSSLP